MQWTDTANPATFHKVVDCQWACPAHTPVPEYIRLIAQGRYTDAYLINWVSNVFPGILGRTCDRPCEPACRRGRVEENNGEKPEPVAICRLKRVAADHKDRHEWAGRLPARAAPNGRRGASRHLEVAPARRAAADEHRVEALAQHAAHRLDALAAAEGDAEVEHALRLLVDHRLGQAELRDLRAHEAAGLGFAVEHRNVVAQRRQVSRHGQ